jgi:hypothetical protein
MVAKIGLRLAIAKYRTRAKSRDVTFVSIFWGPEFADMFVKLMVPSLCGLGGLSRIASQYNVKFEVYTPGADGALIEPGLRALRSLPVDVRLYAGFVGDDPDTNLNRLGHYLTQIWGAHEREGCVTVMAQPDHVIGSGLLGLLDRFTANQYVVSGHPRVSKESGFPAITERLAQGTIGNNGDLVRLCAREHPHVTFRTALGSDEGWLRACDVGNGFAVFFKEPPPLLLQARKDCLAVLTGSSDVNLHEQIDHEIVDLMYRQGRLVIVDDSRDFFWAEMSSDKKSIPTVRNLYWSKAAQMLNRTELRWYEHDP